MHLKYLIPQLGIAKRLSGKRDPFNEFKRNMNTMIDQALRGYSVPELGYGDLNIDVCDKGKVLEVKVEVPGVSEEDLHINIQENNLIITGEKKSETKQEKNNYYMMERVYGTFMRSIPLPFQVKGNAVEAELDQGVLTIRVAKPKETPSASQAIKIKKKK